MDLLTPDTGLLVWQVIVLASWVLSILIIVRGARRNDSKLLLFGAVSFLIPVLTTIPYFLFTKK